MDTSNPVIPQDRRTVQDVLIMQRRKRRQDLGYLQEVARTAQRIELPVRSNRLSEGEVRSICQKFREQMPQVDSSKSKGVPDCLVQFAERVPVSGLMLDGIPVHPPSVNNTKGSVSVRRQMGGTPNPPLGLPDIVRVAAEQVLDISKVYTAGTWEGFIKRLDKQMSRKVHSVCYTYNMVYGSTPTMKSMFKKLDELLPRHRVEGYPSLSDPLSAHFAVLKITASSSAGAPYWRNKGECMEEILVAGLEKAVEACSRGKPGVEELFRKDPEMFLCEIKNKLDRYDVDRLNEKTRPYCCVPAHWCLLFSVVCQKFQEGLETFEQNFRGSNAYGFTAVRGGLMKFYEWMQTADKRGKFVCYGDDTCLVVRKGDGVYRVDPDFQQMDGSVHQRDIELVVKYMVETLCREDQLDEQQCEFWRQVAAVWIDMASDPILIMDGTTIYKKKRPTGLLSGIPGTTLFDTVKSVVSWELYLDNCQMRGIDPLDGVQASKFMEAQGLIIKPGTWKPERVPELVPGNLITSHKFLGVQMLVEEYNGRTIIVPTVPYKEAVEMLVVQKDDPHAKRESEMTRKRRLYDRMRGLFMTVGFTHPHVVDMIHEVVNNLDPGAILMCTNIGTGERPESILMEDYAYPDSSGFPTVDYCKALFAGEDEQEGWISLFPSLEEMLQFLRMENREVEMKKVVGEVGGVEVQYPTMVEAETQVNFPELDPSAFVKAAQPKLKAENIPVRAHIDGQAYLPDLGESIVKSLDGVGSALVAEVCNRFCINPQQLRVAAVKHGLYMTGESDDSIVSLVPVIQPDTSFQDGVALESAQRADVVSRGVERRVQVKESLSTPKKVLDTRPTQILVAEEFLPQLSARAPIKEGDQNIVGMFMKYVSQSPNIAANRWKTVGVVPTDIFPVTAALEVKLRNANVWVVVAQASSTSLQLAREYIAWGVLSAKKFPRFRDGNQWWKAAGPFEVKMLYKEETSLWADETLTELPQNASVEVPPSITNVSLKELNFSDLLKETESGGAYLTPPQIQRALAFYHLMQGLGKTRDEAVSLFKRERERALSPPDPEIALQRFVRQGEELASLEAELSDLPRGKHWKKLRGTPEKRAKRNKKLSEKRKRLRTLNAKA